MKYLLFICLIGLFGCSKSNVNSLKQEIVVIDGQGHKYRLVKPESKNSDGTSTVELWEKIDPTNSKFYYTPTLSSKLYTNNLPLFNSIMR